LLSVIGIFNDNELLAFTGCGSGLAAQQVDTTFRCCGRPSTILLLTREDGKHSAASLIEALAVQLMLVGVLGQLTVTLMYGEVQKATLLVTVVKR